MKTLGPQPLFEFESADALAQFLVWMTPLVGGGVIAAISLDLAGWRALAVIAMVCLAIALGLRSRISVYSGRVVVQRTWFFLSYRTYEAAAIDDVSYGGDWGLEEGAIGVVVSMGGREIHLGTSKNMRFLHDELTRVAYSGKGHEG